MPLATGLRSSPPESRPSIFGRGTVTPRTLRRLGASWRLTRAPPATATAAPPAITGTRIRRAVVVTASAALARAPVPLADPFAALRWLALVFDVDRLRLALVLARLRLAVAPFAPLPDRLLPDRLLPDLAPRLALGFDALAERLRGLAEPLLLRLDWAMGSSWFTLDRRGARPAASAPRRCGRSLRARARRACSRARRPIRRSPAHSSTRGRGSPACTPGAPRRLGREPRSRRRARDPSRLLRLAHVAHGDAPFAAGAVELGEVDAQFVGDANGRLGGLVLLRPALLATLAELADLARGGEPEIPRLLRGGVSDLAGDDLRHLLGQRARLGRRRGAAVRLRLLRAAVAARAEALRGTPERLSGALAGLPDALRHTARRLAGLAEGLADAADELIEVARRLSGALADVADRLSGALADVADRLSGALAHVSDRLPGALADVPDGLSGALADIADRLARALADVAHGMAGALADVAGRLAAALADVLQRRRGALADVLGRVARLVDGLAGALAHLGDGPAEALDQLGVAVEAGHQAIDDRADVVEPGLHDQLRLDALDVELDPAQVKVDAHVELDQVQDPCLEGHMRIEVVKLEVDRVDPQLGHVEQDVGRPDAVLLVLVDVLAVLAVGLVDLVASLLGRAQPVSVAARLLAVGGRSPAVARATTLGATRPGTL